MKKRLVQLIALVWLLASIYYATTGLSSIVAGRGSPGRAEVVRLAAALWVGSAAALLLSRRAAGWWVIVAFNWFALGGQTNRWLAQRDLAVSLRGLEPFLWILGWLLVLVWLRSNFAGRSGIRDDTPAVEARALADV